MNQASNSTTILEAEKKISGSPPSAIQATLLVSLLFFFWSFARQFFHEGGHALVNLIRGIPVTLFYAHPFPSVGFVRPAVGLDNAWSQASGSIAGILVPLLIFILLWKRRSHATLPYLMIFPWTAIFHGIGGALDIAGRSGDIQHIIRITGSPVIALYMMNILLAGIGIFFFLALTPLLGLAPEDKRSLYVLPVGMLLYCALGLVFVYLVVPGTPADVQFQLAGEIITSAKYRLLLMGSIGLLLAVVYVTLYRRLYPRLPAWLRTETIHLTWKDLRLPAGLAAVSVILGLIIIT